MVTLHVNGKSYNVNVPDTNMPLLWVLRDLIGLTGTKYGCGIEVCGACTVLMDGEAQRSCAIDVGSATGHQITTVEGLSSNRSHPLQKAWVQLQVPQCGYCQSGMLMSACSVLNQHPRPADADINEITNICVCGTYQRVRAAIKLAPTLP